MRRSWILAALLLPAPAAPAGEEAPPAAQALAAALRSEDPARRREALERLLARSGEFRGEEADRLRPALGRLLDAEPDPLARALAVRGLAALGGSASLPVLLRALGTEGEPAPQAALVESFADLPAAEAGAALSRIAFGSGDPGVRALAAEALGRVPGDGPLRALLALAETTHPWPVQAAVLLGLAPRGDPGAVDAAVRALRSGDPAVRAAAREAAEALLGEDLGPDAEAWEVRWAAVRPRWTRPAPGSRRAGAPVSAPAPAPEVRSTARFFGIPVAGARVAFVFDCSQSMWGPKSESARAELLAALKGLRSGQRFGAVFFNEAVWTWRGDLVPATPAMKWALARTIPDLPTRSYTNIHDALERAFGWAGAGRFAASDPPGLDEVFLLTDGEPNRGRTRDPAAIAAAARAWNASAGARIHTVALGERPAADLLLRLSREGGGVSVRR